MTWDIAVDQAQRLMWISGELTIFSVQDVHARLLEAFAGAEELSVDLSKVTEIDTAGLQLMLLAKRWQEKTVRFCNHSDEVLRMIDLANIGQTLGDPLVIEAS